MEFSDLTFKKEKYRNSLGEEHPIRLALSDVESRFKNCCRRVARNLHRWGAVLEAGNNIKRS